MAILDKSGKGDYEIPKVKNGMYPAQYVGEPERFTSQFADDDGNFPERYRHTFAVDVGGDEPVELSAFTSTKCGHEKATLTKYFVAARGQEFVDAVNADDDADFDTDDLIGYPVVVTVKNKPNKDGVKVPRIESVDAADE